MLRRCSAPRRSRRRSDGPTASAVSGTARARDHLISIAARPRPAGSAAEAAARAYCAGVLREAGFDVREEPFEYSAFPGRYATAVGGLCSMALLVAASALGSRGRPAVALSVLALGGAGLAVAAVSAARIGVVRAPVMRRRAVNLCATRGALLPAVWLVAHIDSKSQPVPILVRAAAVALHGLTWAAAVALCAAGSLGATVPAAWPWLGAAAVLTGVPIAVSVVGAGSAGAIDNASGVAAVLLAAAELPRDASAGVLITSAEELGLAGARAWVNARAPGIAVNCDGIDDHGPLVCMYSGTRPSRLVDTFARVARSHGKAVEARRLLPGVLVDGVAFSDAGWEVLTLSRGSAATLGRIHTSRDNLDRLSGAGVDDVAPILAEVARALT